MRIGVVRGDLERLHYMELSPTKFLHMSKYSISGMYFSGPFNNTFGSKTKGCA
jgi:hypothetical protein